MTREKSNCDLQKEFLFVFNCKSDSALCRGRFSDRATLSLVQAADDKSKIDSLKSEIIRELREYGF